MLPIASEDAATRDVKRVQLVHQHISLGELNAPIYDHNAGVAGPSQRCAA